MSAIEEVKEQIWEWMEEEKETAELSQAHKQEEDFGRQDIVRLQNVHEAPENVVVHCHDEIGLYYVDREVGKKGKDMYEDREDAEARAEELGIEGAHKETVLVEHGGPREEYWMPGKTQSEYLEATSDDGLKLFELGLGKEDFEYPDAGSDAQPEVQRAIDRFRSEDREEILLYWLLGSGTPPYKMSMEDAEYQDRPNGEEKCANCEYMYQSNDGGYICSQVRDNVERGGWCRLWEQDDEAIFDKDIAKSGEVEIKHAEQSDIEQVVEIEKSLFPEPRGRITLSRAIDEPHWALLVAKIGSNVVGHSLVCQDEIAAVAVHPDYRGNGYGKRLVETSIDVGRKWANRIKLKVREENDVALSLYRSLGFETDQRLHQFYRNGDDALEMSLTLEARSTIYKRRVYIDDPVETPQGATVEVGPEGGLYYDTETVEDFEEYVQNHRKNVFSEHDFTDEQVDKAESTYDNYSDDADQIFADVSSAGTENIVTAQYRVKSVASMLEKVHVRDTKYEEIEELNDVLGTRVDVEDATQIKSEAEEIEENMVSQDYSVVEKKDYVENPKGYYRAVHYIFEDNEGKTFELQVKSEELDEIIEVGHETVYKNVYDMEEDVLEDIEECLIGVVNEQFGEIEEPSCTETAMNAIREVM